MVKTEYVDNFDKESVKQLIKNGFFARNGNCFTKIYNPKKLVAIESEIDGVDVASIAFEIKDFLRNLHIKDTQILFSNYKLKEHDVFNKKVFGIILSNTEKDEMYSGVVASGCYRFEINDVTKLSNTYEVVKYLTGFADKSIIFENDGDVISGKIYFYDVTVCESKMLRLVEYLDKFDKINHTTLMVSSTRFCYPITNFDYFCEIFSPIVTDRECFNYESEMGNFTANNECVVIKIRYDGGCVQRIKEYLRVFLEECNG